MKQKSWCFVALVGALAGACVRGPQLQTLPSLGLRRVVVYRNGVAYFERAGRVEEERVEFRVRQREVGDFLATLAVMERGSSSVRSAAFPLPREARPGQPEPSPEERRTVRMTLDGRGHDLVVGYLAETPIWRPSYRLVLGAQNEVYLQAYGIVQNLSGEDWNGVNLSLVTGAPVSFRSELAEPVITERPLVTDRGEVIDAVPQGDTTLAQANAAQNQPAQPTAPPSPEAIDGLGDAEEQAYAAAERAAGVASRSGGGAGRRSRAPMAPRRVASLDASQQRFPRGGAPLSRNAEVPRFEGPSRPRSVASLAAVAVQGGVTRYDLPNAVTVPDRSATMVLLSSRDVPGERLYLFAPDGGVPDSARHPFNVARFVNRTGAMLERGPIAIFERGAFLGQGLIDPLPTEATAVVPFALERGLAVDSTTVSAVEGARLLRIRRGEVLLERYNTTRTTYRARNGMERDVRLLVRVSTPEGVSLFEPPAGTEQSNGASLVPLQLTARGSAEQLVVLRTPFAVNSNWADPQAQEAIRAYLGTAGLAPELREALRSTLELQEQSSRLSQERDELQTRLSDLQTNAQETRDNLEAIRRNPGAADLRTRLTQRLSQVSGQIDQLSRRIVELDTQLGERRVRLSEAWRTIEVDASNPARNSTPPAAAAPTPPPGPRPGR